MLLIAVTASVVLRVVACISLLALTIWGHRKNRGVALGVVTVMLFFGFLFYVRLVDNPHVQGWAAPVVFAFIVCAGFAVTALVVADVIHWFKSEWKTNIVSRGPGKPETK